MDFMIVVLYTLVVVVSLLLIALILVQQPKSGGFGSNFGGLGESVFGAHASSHMTKMTVIFTSIFFALTLLLAVFVGHRPAKASVISRHQPKATVTVDESTIESDSEKQISTEAAGQTPVVEKENVKKSESKE